MKYTLCYTVCVNHGRKRTEKSSKINESENIGEVSKTGRFASLHSVAYFSSKIKLIHQTVGSDARELRGKKLYRRKTSRLKDRDPVFVS